MKVVQEQVHQANPIMMMPTSVWRAYIEPKASLFDQIEILPENQKLILALHYYEGLSFAEIARLMEINEWDAIVCHTEALTSIQAKLKESSFTEE